MLSLPPLPVSVLSPALPPSVSAKLEPIRFSIDDSVSVPSPTVFCAVVVASNRHAGDRSDIGGGVDAVAAIQRVVAVLADQRVVVVAAVQRVVVGAAVQRVVARIAVQDVVAGKALHVVVAAAAGEGVVAGGARQRVGEVRADEVLDGGQRVGAVAPVFCARSVASDTVTPATAPT